MNSKHSSDWITIAERMEVTNERPSGFDYLRLGLAVMVLLVHSQATTWGEERWAGGDLWADSPLRPFLRAILPMFFALSGFLVAGSLERCKTALTFAGLRVIRIYRRLWLRLFFRLFSSGRLSQHCG